MKKLIVFIFLGFCSNVLATTFSASTCNQTDVQTAITQAVNAAHDGDVVSIPAGNCTWTGTMNQSFTHSLTIQGAGAISATSGGSSTTGSDATSITNNVGQAMMFATTSGKSFRFTGIAIIGTSVNAANGMLEISGTSAAVRVDHCHIYTTSVGLRLDGSVLGVADHNFFESAIGSQPNNPIAVHNGTGWNGASSDLYADSSWADTDHFGSSQFFFFEDNQWLQGDIGDAHDGARYVLRYSTVTGTHGQMYNHGLTDARGRSTRAAEVYHMNFNRTVQDGAPSYAINSGTLLYWGNTSTNYRNMVGQDYTRKDNGTYPYGTTPTGWGNCNGTTVSTGWDGPSPGYPCLDQPGRGAGDLLSGNFPNVVNTARGNVIASPRQVLSPVYLWNNTFNDAGFSPEGILGVGWSLFTDNTDYYQQFGTYAEPGIFNGTTGVGQGLVSARPSTCTAGPGGNTPGVGYWGTDTNTLYVCNPTNTWTAYYTPYTYPHPLTGNLGQPAPPTNLVVTAH